MSNAYCGYIAIIGRPNVGKSTLLNQLLQEKISITSKKPQTTRQQILGILTEGDYQAIFVDTPGLHKDQKRAMNRLMNRAARHVLKDVDLILFIVEALKWTDEDEWVLNKLAKTDAPIILLINKIDTLKNQNELLPYIELIQTKGHFNEIIPISALKQKKLEILKEIIFKKIPQSVHYFPDDQKTSQSQQFRASEIVREKLIRHVGEELPYSTGIQVDTFKVEKNILHIHMILWVERKGQKTIIIGKNGERLKKIGTLARKEMELLFHKKIYLNLWVKVKENWTDNLSMLNQLGYDD